jgi:hypothetical protein
MYKHKYNWATSLPTAVRGNAWQQYTNPNRQVAQNYVPWCPIFVIVGMELASYRNSEVLDSDVSSGFLKMYGLLKLASCKNEVFF